MQHSMLMNRKKLSLIFLCQVVNTTEFIKHDEACDASSISADVKVS